MRERIELEEIYRASLGVFAQYGFRKTTVEDIAEKLDRTKGNLYFYVKDKRELYIKTVSFALERWQNRVRDAVAAETGARKQLLVLCRKAVEYLSQDGELRDILKQDPDIFPMFPTVDPYESINKRSIRMITGILKKGIKEKVFRPVDVDKVSQVIFSIYKMVIIRTYIKADDGFVQEMFEDTLDLLLNGLFIESERSGGTG
ncbi:MAG: hypothetical protein CVV44_07045 [Spirochaetae bacterium HGW-Spirochaetae-1]|jgi:AcrR family transcriptional regulator|nr:MAG: hypothetical protein CVV44_07045 [Spirochaetae bacterium HGW-Spirochaetae-1]